MPDVRLIALPLVLLVFTGASAETEIFRCPLQDGTIAFQEMPCAEPVEESDVVPEVQQDPPEPDAIEPISQIPVDEPLPRPVSGSRSECEKAARDAIDAIDLQMRASNYTREELEGFKAELRVLTRQLRACKQL